MITRAGKRKIRRGPRYYTVDVPGMDPHDMRVPTPMYQSLIAQAMRNRGLLGLEDVDYETEDGAATLAKMWSVGCAALALSWFNRSLDLETPRDVDDLDEYGDAVQMEILDHGYTVEQLTPLMVESYKHILSFGLPTQTEVDDTADFTAATKAEPTS